MSWYHAWVAFWLLVAIFGAYTAITQSDFGERLRGGAVAFAIVAALLHVHVERQQPDFAAKREALLELFR